MRTWKRRTSGWRANAAHTSPSWPSSTSWRRPGCASSPSCHSCTLTSICPPSEKGTQLLLQEKIIIICREKGRPFQTTWSLTPRYILTWDSSKSYVFLCLKSYSKSWSVIDVGSIWLDYRISRFWMKATVMTMFNDLWYFQL